jgi:hypothetical protein
MILAEDIGGWLVAAAALFGGLGLAALAALALIPAFNGKRSIAVCLAAPALILGILVTIWIWGGYFKSGLHDSEADIAHDVVMPWIVMAGPSLLMSVITMAVAWGKRPQAN